MIHKLTSIYLTVLGLFIGCVSAAAQAAEGSGLAYVQHKDVVYGEVHGTGLLMDVFVPAGRPNGLAIVDVVSGAWYSDRGKIRDHTTAQLYRIFCSSGYVVFGVRPGSRTRYTAAEMDQHVKKAIRFIKDRAGEYRIDPDRLGLTGASAGGHLATLAALTPLESDPSAKTPADRHSTAVRAVGVFFPPTDFLDWSGDGKRADLAVLGALLFVGGAAGRSDEEIVEKARAVSPVFRVGKPTIPFLFIHGDADRVVPLVHSERMVEAIKRGGGQAELLVKAGGGHPWLTLPEEVEVLARWFDKQLKGSGVAPTGPR